MRLIGLLLLAAAMPAAAEFAVVEDTETFTVYQDGNQYIVLVDTTSKSEMREVAKSRSPERATNANFRSQLSGKDMFYFYLVRTRMLDGVPVCEKFFQKNVKNHDVKLILQILALAPCGQSY